MQVKNHAGEWAFLAPVARTRREGSARVIFYGINRIRRGRSQWCGSGGQTGMGAAQTILMTCPEMGCIVNVNVITR